MSLLCSSSSSSSVAPSHEPVWLPAFQHIKGSSLTRLGGYLSGKRETKEEKAHFSQKPDSCLHPQFFSNKSVVCQGPSATDDFVQGLHGNTEQSLWHPFCAPFSSQVTNNGLLIVWKTPEQLCPLFWWQGRHFKVWSSIMASLLLFLEQASGEKT